jgi:hypothetical protein
MGKGIVRKGQRITEEENEKWHKELHQLTPEQHETMMKKMGISGEEDRNWHESQRTPEQAGTRQRPINPFAVGGGFLNYCIKQGWLIQEGKGRTAKYYATEVGTKELRKYGIEI